MYNAANSKVIRVSKEGKAMIRCPECGKDFKHKSPSQQFWQDNSKVIRISRDTHNYLMDLTSVTGKSVNQIVDDIVDYWKANKCSVW